MKWMARTMELAGTNYETGKKLGKMAAGIPALREYQTAGLEGFGPEQVREAREMFDRWCPGLSEELDGFADALEVESEQVFFYGMTSLLPRCSQIALSAEMTACGRPLMGRSYEFSHEAEDFTLMRTSVAGKYTHLGSSVLSFGRDEGLNEHGLVVSMSSCGFPVGALPFMRAPKLKGLQFWAVIRALLENCKTVAECLDYLVGMPIAYNLNLMLMDRDGDMALVETLDGEMGVLRLDGRSYLHATNHPVVPGLVEKEPHAMRHSLLRYRWIAEQLDGRTGVTPEELKGMLEARFPLGLCCHAFPDYFGTTKSLIFDPQCGTIELLWGGNPTNGWKQYSVAEPLEETATEIEFEFEALDPVMGNLLPLS